VFAVRTDAKAVAKRLLWEVGDVHLRRELASDQSPSWVLCCVYRKRNAAYVERLLAQLPSAPGIIRLWALDDVVTSLAPVTVGQGPGCRVELLNRLVDHTVLASGYHVVIADDDVTFVGPDGLAHLLVLSRRLDLDLSQPAHAAGSNYTWSFARSKPWLHARTTRFVEIGPLVHMSPRFAQLAFPTEQLGPGDMGFGLEELWSRLVIDHEWTMGILDGVRIRHHGTVGASYNVQTNMGHLSTRVGRSGPHGMRNLHEDLLHWPIHRRLHVASGRPARLRR
jgi:hypothetical protein